MNKRQKKKHQKSLITVKDISGSVDILIKKKYWNRGFEKTLTVDNTGDFISLDYISSRGFRYIISFKNCRELTASIRKSFDNRNRILKK